MTKFSNTDTTAVFKELCSLVGNWDGVTEEGNAVSIAYSLNANDTALVEHWFFHGGVEALTIYHLDEGRLMATHYCPIGNQPRLDLARRLVNGALEFEYVSATNLPNFDTDHAHKFDVRIIDPVTMHRNETYLCNGNADSNGTTFRRVAE